MFSGFLLMKEDHMKKELVFVTGFFGSDTEEQARKIAEERGFDFLSLDREIEKQYGRSVQRISMTMGEHEYRNREYETLVHICSHAERPAVVACGDGVLLDDMSASLIKEHELIILDMDTDVDVLWQNALKTGGSTYHAFMYGKDQQQKRRAFDDLHRRRKALYERRVL